MARLVPRKPSKYRAKPQVVDGIRFPSQKQASRYRDLKLLESQNLIRELRLEVTYRMKIDGVKICSFRADFVYDEYAHGVWTPVVEDTKGYKGGAAYTMFRLKKRLMKAILGIDVKES